MKAFSRKPTTNLLELSKLLNKAEILKGIKAENMI